MKHPRKITRLPHYDYRQNGAYVITICVYGRREVFGEVRDGEMFLNRFGEFAYERWLALPEHHAQVELDEFIVMPNHFHGILWLVGEPPPDLNEDVERKFGELMEGSLSAVGGSYKSSVSRQINRVRGQKTKVWQRGFYDHIIRHDKDLFHQREYIRNNPANWQNDEFNALNRASTRM